MKKLLVLIIPFVLASCTAIGQTSLFNLSRYIRLNGQKIQYDSTRVGAFKNLATEGYVQGWVATHAGGGSGISLTTIGTTGLATLGSGVLNVPNYQGQITLTTTGTSGGASFGLNTLNIPHYQALISGTGLVRASGTIISFDNTSYQAALVSGTSIKTVNSTSLLGSGDVPVQSTLVSGTNIKTINGNTVLGSGNITITGGFTGALTVALVDGASIAVDATAGYITGATYDVTLGGNRTISNPTGSVDGQRIIFRLRQDGTGSRTISWGSAFRFSVDLPVPVLSTSAGFIDYVAFEYNSASTKWDIISVNIGVN